MALDLRLQKHMALVNGRALSLTIRELQLLAAFVEHPERIVTREELYRQVWGGSPGPADRSVDVYVSRLRTKLAQALPDRKLIHTHTGIGYRFSPD